MADGPRDPIETLLSATRVLRAPKRRLATFGSTRIEYHLISAADGLEDRTRLREGAVVSARPAILTPDAFKERFEGFGDDAAEFARWASTAYRDLLRALEYNFRNQGQAARVLAEKPPLVAERMLADFDARGVEDQAVIACPDGAWSLALMKFTLDEAARSFPGHVQDLERRGMFSPDRGEGDRRRREVEDLLSRARADRALRDELGRKLKEYGLFEEYEDRFLSLF
ncbi:MAG: hypothetical protein HY079_08140 [Elusimicrobia bacterium]|nr:hypothetical protein [Elusimicrobiota bacterium]